MQDTEYIHNSQPYWAPDTVEPEQPKRLRGLWALIVLLVLLVAFLLNDRSKQIAKADQWKSMAVVESKQALYWRNKEGLAQAEVQAGVANTNIIAEIKDKEKAALLKQVSGLKKNLSNLQSITTIATETSGEVRTTVRDSIIYKSDSTTTTARSSSYSDKWVHLTVTFSEDQADWYYSFYDSLTFVGVWKKDHWYSFNKKLFVNAQAFNPHSSIRGFTSIQAATKRRSRIAIGPYVGVNVLGRPQVGIGLFYRLFEF